MGKRRPRASTNSGRKRAARHPKPSPPNTHRHPLYGDIPLLVVTWTDADGRERASYRFDPDHRPPLPPGAIRGDVSRQCFCSVHEVPRYFYLDQPRRCVQCREEFVFSAREQKHWYEALQFNFASVAIRCRDCRRKRRSDKALHHAVDDAKRQLAATPDAAAAELALAEAIVQLRERMGRGNLDQAIAAARKARSARDPPSSAGLCAETLFFEAKAQALAGRSDRARALYQAFVAEARSNAQRRKLREASAWLDRNG